MEENQTELLESFRKKFEDFLLTLGDDDGFDMKYYRPAVPHQFTIWVQSFLDPLGISSADFKLEKGKLKIENVEWDSLGSPTFPYEIQYKENDSTPKNISEIKLKL